MNKKIIAVLLTVLTALSILVSCKKKDDDKVVV